MVSIAAEWNWLAGNRYDNVYTHIYRTNGMLLIEEFIRVTTLCMHRGPSYVSHTWEWLFMFRYHRRKIKADECYSQCHRFALTTNNGCWLRLCSEVFCGMIQLQTWCTQIEFVRFVMVVCIACVHVSVIWTRFTIKEIEIEKRLSSSFFVRKK